MSNFNITTTNAAGSAITLGGEWTSRDRAKANKYKSILYDHMKQKRRPIKPRSENERPKSTPGIPSSEADTDLLPHTPPPKSAPPGAKPRCDRFFDVDQWATRKALSPHLKLRKSPRNYSRDESPVVREYSLGSGMTMAKRKNKVSVTIDTGLPMNMPAKPEIPQQLSEFRSSSTDNGRPESRACILVELSQESLWNAKGAKMPITIRVDYEDHTSMLCNLLNKRGSNKVNILADFGYSLPRMTTPGSVSRDSPGIRTGSFHPDTALYSPDSGTLHELSTSSTSPSLSEALITQLQQQVSDLSVFLGEERLNHKATKEKAAAVMNERLQELDSKHLDRFQQMQEDYEDKMDVMKQIHAKEKEHQKTTLNTQIARMRGELEFLQGAFDAYKKTLVQDMEEKWAKKEQDLRHKLQEDMDSALHQQRMQMTEERNLDKNAMTREFQKEMQDMAKEHKREVESMMKKFSSASSDVENLRRALDQLKAVRDELDQTVEKLAVTEEILQDTRQELQEANLTILNFQDNFRTRVDEVDGRYKAKMDLLMQDNIELRKRYIGKCNELFNEKSNTEYKRVEKIATTKELLQMVVHAKNRSNVNMASGDNDTRSTRQKLVRPVSAPNTKRECRLAFQNAGDAERQGRYVEVDKGEPVRPQTTSPSHRKLNRESLHENSFRTLKASSQH